MGVRNGTIIGWICVSNRWQSFCRRSLTCLVFACEVGVDIVGCELSMLGYPSNIFTIWIFCFILLTCCLFNFFGGDATLVLIYGELWTIGNENKFQCVILGYTSNIFRTWTFCQGVAGKLKLLSHTPQTSTYLLAFLMSRWWSPPRQY